MTKLRLSPDVSPVIASSERFAPLAKLLDRWQNLPTWKATPWHIPSVDATLLPYLAEMFGIADTVAWQQAQTEDTRRSLVQMAYTRSSQIGTTAGMGSAVADVGGRVTRIIAPPHKTYLSGDPTVAERNAWLARYPELRLYPRRPPGKKEVAHLGADHLGYKCHPGQSTALFRSRIRPTLVKNGVETELETVSTIIANKSQNITNYISIPGQRGHDAYLGAHIRHLCSAPGGGRILLEDVTAYTEPTATLALRTASVGLTPINVDGELIAEIRPRPLGATFLGFPPRHLAATNAELYSYRRIKLYDPSLPVSQVIAASHLGYTRLGMPAHTAEVKVALFGHRNPLWGRFLGVPVVSDDKARTARATLLTAMRAAKRASDKILLDTNVYRPVKAGRFKAGTVRAGQFSNQ